MNHRAISPNRARSAVGALCVAALVAACAGPGYDLPAIVASDTGLSRAGEFVWVDLVTDDVDGSLQFYADLFGWSFEEQGEYYGVSHEGRRIGGVARRAREDLEARGSAWVPSLSVEDVDAAAARAEAAGGRLEVGPADAGRRGRAALVSDPGGALFMLLSARGGDPEAHEARPGEWLWRELWCLDSATSVAFYRALAGYDAVETDFRDTDYVLLESNGEPRAGVVEDPRKEIEPFWLPYVRVESKDRVVEQARGLGARIVAQSERAAILVDPAGAAFGVQEWDGRRKR